MRDPEIEKKENCVRKCVCVGVCLCVRERDGRMIKYISAVLCMREKNLTEKDTDKQTDRRKDRERLKFCANVRTAHLTLIPFYLALDHFKGLPT